MQHGSRATPLLGSRRPQVSVDGGSLNPLSRGLSEKEAAARLKAEGPNTLPQADRRTFVRIVHEMLREPMFALLLGAAVIYLALGDLKEAVVLGIFACTSVLIAVVQESRTERVLESLRDLTSPRALVICDGVEKRIAGAEVVRGGLVILAEGDRVPADATVLSAHDLQCDESLLTGEAVPVRKIASPGAPPARPVTHYRSWEETIRRTRGIRGWKTHAL
jgi:P-type Ca2+ transporter type 2C